MSKYVQGAGSILVLSVAEREGGYERALQSLRRFAISNNTGMSEWFFDMMTINNRQYANNVHICPNLLEDE